MTALDLRIQILQNLPEEYENVEKSLEIQLEDGALDIKRVKKKIRAKYERFMKKESKILSETALSMTKKD